MSIVYFLDGDLELEAIRVCLDQRLFHDICCMIYFLVGYKNFVMR